jgi:hypothetical protein
MVARIVRQSPDWLFFKSLDQTSGTVLWEMDVPAAHAPVIADVDGDGLCEIVQGCLDGAIRVYKP